MKNLWLSILALIAFSSTAISQNKQACLVFDGDDDKVVIDHQSALNLGRSAFTIEAWITASGNMTANAVLSPIVYSKKGANSTSTDGMLFGLDGNGKIALQIEGQSFQPGFGGGGSPGIPAADLRDGVCHHIAWTREYFGPNIIDTVNGYQDAALVRKTRLAADTFDISNTEDAWIGASEFNTSPFVYQFEGQIKEVRIWNYAKTESEIWTDKGKHMTGSENGLLFYWRLNEDSAVTAYDCGPNGADGTLDGAQWGTYICNNMDNIPLPNNCIPAGPGPTQINEIDEVEISVYPNPVIDEINISKSDYLNIDRVKIFDINGKMVLEQNWNGNIPLNVSKFEKGTYLILLNNRGNIRYKALITKN